MSAEFINHSAGSPLQMSTGSSASPVADVSESESFEQAMDTMSVDDVELDESHQKEFSRYKSDDERKSPLDQHQQEGESEGQQESDQKDEEQDEDETQDAEKDKKEKSDRHQSADDNNKEQAAGDDDLQTQASASEAGPDENDSNHDKAALQGETPPVQYPIAPETSVVLESNTHGPSPQAVVIQHPAPTMDIPLMSSVRSETNSAKRRDRVGAASKGIRRHRKWILYILAVVFASMCILGGVFFYYWYRWENPRNALEDALTEHDDLEADVLTAEQRQLLAENLDPHLAEALNSITVLVISNQAVIGIRYVRKETPLPLVMIKEKGFKAAMVLAAASQRGVPIFENDNLVKVLWKKSRVNGFIPPEVIQDVARITARASRVLEVHSPVIN